MKLSDFDYDLSEGSIAEHPAAPRESARLMHVKGDLLGHHTIADLPSFFEAGDVVVVNNTKVIPARLFGRRDDVQVEVLLHRMQMDGEWEAFAKPAKRLKPGQLIMFSDDLSAEVMDKKEDGRVVLQFNQCHDALMLSLEAIGKMPLPPYIKREEEHQDKTNYQTTYAKHEGAVAAPTAGLHLTETIREQLEAKGVRWVEITLHVGAGTFQPVKVDNISDHVMHEEYIDISEEAADCINNRKGKLIAVGTTSLRSLEAAADDKGQVHAMKGDTDIFITPGYRFKTADRMLTNFHLPKSTLMMLVTAFADYDPMMAAYVEAIKQNYRFYSYGDACLLERA